jgi:hypothetical protein
MNEVPTVTMWMGKNVDEMTREELIDAVKTLGRLYTNALDHAARDIRVLGRAHRH